MLREFNCKAKKNNELFRFFLNWDYYWTDDKRFPTFTFEHYQRVIEKKIEIGDCLLLDRNDFNILGAIMRVMPGFSNNNFSVLTKFAFTDSPEIFNTLVAELVRIRKDHKTHFSAIPKNMST